MQYAVGFISLGCSKNLVDTEMMVGLLSKNNFNITNNIETADIVIINTCGFIESAKEEAINTILEVCQNKGNKLIIVAGCLVQRYLEDLKKEILDVDLWLKISDYENISKLINELLKKNKIENQVNNNDILKFNNRVIATNAPYAYVRVADGCANRCTYCAIPLIRGNYKSRTIEDILEEVEYLTINGIKEINLIAQDTTRYGLDIYGELKLVELIRKISENNNVEWIRILYMYPELVTEELIQEIKVNPKVVKYFDIPIQHISDNILTKMNRRGNSHLIKELFIKIKTNIPDSIIRSTLIIGFPGETEQDFLQIINFVTEFKIDKLGAFTYSKEEDTPAFDMENQIKQHIASERLDKIMKIQQKISINKNKERVGKEYIALIESITEDEKFLVARTYAEAPDNIDGKVYIEIDRDVVIGDFAKIKVIDANEYDLFAKLI